MEVPRVIVEHRHGVPRYVWVAVAACLAAVALAVLIIADALASR